MNRNGRDLVGEASASNLRMMDETTQKAMMFEALRAANLLAIRNLVTANRSLVTAKMYGYEGSDVFETIKNSKTKRCYTYTGHEKDGFFFPLHVAAEAGHKQLCLLLVKAGADPTVLDYRGRTAEEACNGEAQHAFYELRGLRFAASERYEGKVDRSQKRTGQGSLYVKQEGYMERETLFYRGGFKNGVFQGHGTLYWPGGEPGAERLCYMGRFKGGLRHGRGVEFDQNGKKIYQGSFREDKREGRGDEFTPDGFRCYKGEFSANARHGFGAAFYPEGFRFLGRFENGVKTGVGVLTSPNGDRFEGMFYNDKQDGPGSYYEYDPKTGTYKAQHYMWAMSRKVKEITLPFVPKRADMPEVSAHADTVLSAISFSGQALDDQEDGSAALATALSASKASRRRSVTANAAFPDEFCEDNWKVQLAKYVRLPVREAQAMGISIASETSKRSSRAQDGGSGEKGDGATGGGADSDQDDNDDENEEEDDMDDVLGFHFVEFTALFVAYVYVCSAHKVFEGRVASRDFSQAAPDFEVVYHLVIDAVDGYNESWEREYRAQQERELQKAMEKDAEEESREATKAGAGGGGGSARKETLRRATSTPSAGAEQSIVGAKRQIFMTDAEKRMELVRRQRAELAAKKGTAELDPEVERRIGNATLAALEQELAKLLADEIDERGHMVASATASTRTHAHWRDDQSSDNESTAPVGNEFAAELLYVMRIATGILG